MRRQNVAAILLGLAVLIFVMAPAVMVSAQGTVPWSTGLVPCGDLGEPACQACHVVSLGKNLIGFAMYVAVFIAVVMIAYAGFKYITAQGDSSKVSDAHRIFRSVVIGLIIILGSWTMVDTLLKTFYGGQLGPWNAIQCVAQPALGQPTGSPSSVVAGAGAASSAYERGDCSAQAFEAAGIAPAQARVFSCFTRNESGCNVNADNPTSSARGVLQILRGFNNTCHNLNLPSCTEAAQRAGYQVSGDLNCSRAFRGGDRIPGPNPLADACDAAASNFTCNAHAAQCLYNNGGYRHWTGAGDVRGRNGQCVQQYAGQ